VIFEVGSDENEKYRRGHIPGAIYFDTNSFEQAPTWNIIAVAELEQVLLAHGITRDMPIVLYGRDPLAVARTVVVLLYAGVADVRWLDGGIEAWKVNGYALEEEPHAPTPARAFGGPLPAHPEYIADIGQVRAWLNDPKAVVVCVRTWEEYTGEVSGYGYIQPKGRIAGSVWGGKPGFERRQYGVGDHWEGMIRRCQGVASTWRSRGITPDKRIVFYCGTGWRASEAFLYAYIMGWKEICVYDGGWLEWSADESNPIKVGEAG
jgi:thiosulfate/3-mercaptopyruvate sulfurtransferase